MNAQSRAKRESAKETRQGARYQSSDPKAQPSQNPHGRWIQLSVSLPFSNIGASPNTATSMSAPDDRKKKRRSGGFTRDDAVEEMTFEDTDISSKRGPAAAASDMDDSQVDEDLEYDDLHEDELEAEDIAETSDAEDDEHLGTIEEAQAKIAAAEAIENSSQPVQRVWRPGVDTMEPDEKLEYEASAYTMMHNIQGIVFCSFFHI